MAWTVFFSIFSVEKKRLCLCVQYKIITRDCAKRGVDNRDHSSQSSNNIVASLGKILIKTHYGEEMLLPVVTLKGFNDILILLKSCCARGRIFYA